MGLKKYQIPDTPEEAMSDFQRLMTSLDSVPDVADAVRTQALAVLHPEDNRRTPNQARLEIAQFGAYVTSTADQIVNAPNLSGRTALSAKPFPRTVLKLAQELLSDPVFRQIFSVEEIEDGNLCTLLEECIFDPRLITDHLLEVFGLDEFKPYEADERGWIYKHEQIAIRARAITAIKDFLADGLEPLEALGGEKLRVFRITKGKNRGKVVVTRSNGDGRKTLELTDLHNIAGRRTEHIKENHTKGDIQILGEIKTMIDSVTRDVIGDWEGFRPKIEELESRVATACMRLSPKVQDENKKIILGRISRCLTMRDKTGRVNPYSRLAILNSTKRFIDKRLRSVASISGYVASDEIVALSHMQDDTVKIRDWYQNMSEKYNGKGAKAGVDRPLIINEVRPAIASLKGHKRTLSVFKFQPYLGIAEKAVAEIDLMLGKLEGEAVTDESLTADFSFIRDSFIKVFAYAKLLEVERRVIDLRNRYFHPSQGLHELHPNTVRVAVSEILQVLRSRQIAPRVTVDGFEGVYTLIFDKIVEMKKIAEEACGRIPIQQSVDLLKQVDGLTRDFSVGEILEDATDKMAVNYTKKSR